MTAAMSGWFAVRCNPQRQFIAVGKLREAGVATFMPIEIRWGNRRGSLGRCKVINPLIRGYLFVLIDLADQWQVLGLEEAHGFLGYMGDDGVTRPLPMPPAMMLELQIADFEGAFDETRCARPVYRPKKGDRAKVTAGVWAGFFAKVIATPKGDRAHVMVEGPHGRGVVLPVSQLSRAG